MQRSESCGEEQSGGEKQVVKKKVAQSASASELRQVISGLPAVLAGASSDLECGTHSLCARRRLLGEREACGVT